MRAAIYLRFSSDMQRDGWTIDSQRRACQAFCAARGYTVSAEYVDEAQSGASTDRPGFAALLDAARARECDVIVVHKLDRFSRSIIDVLTTLRELERVGVAFASASEQFDFTTPIGKVLLTMLAAFAEWYLDNLSAETTRGKRERAAQGRTNGRPPLGYESADGLLVPGARAGDVRAAFERYAAGEWTDRDVAEHLGVAVDTAAAIIRNPVYCGMVTYRGMRGRGRGRRFSSWPRRCRPRLGQRCPQRDYQTTLA